MSYGRLTASRISCRRHHMLWCGDGACARRTFVWEDDSLGLPGPSGGVRGGRLRDRRERGGVGLGPIC
eukprot:361873-Prorocentrum_minimum.AAC.3